MMDNLNNDALALLKRVWGYSSFKGNQALIIKSILEKKDCLAIMATGSGKSICYQLPALLMEGVAVVISPLISLMQDQVAQLKSYGVEAVFLNAIMPIDEYNNNIERILSGAVKIIYIAPEGLASGRLSRALIDGNISVSLIAVDEAHCVSMWGHDFRTEYLHIADFKSIFSATPCIALTATATRKVQCDIIEKLRLRAPDVYIASFNRPNIFLEVERKVKNGFLQVASFLNNHKGECGIVYCFSKKEVDELTLFLQRAGFLALPYHAGLDKSIRTKNQSIFMADGVDIIVATIAFGMGIDKSNVRFVLHCDISKSIEQYYQEIGRAGRDGLPSVAHLLYKASDAMKIRTFFSEVSDKAQAERLLNLMCNYATTTSCRRKIILDYFGEKYNSTDTKCCCDNCKNGEKSKSDVTISAQKFMCSIIRAGGNLPPYYIIRILRGSRDKKILENGHDKLSTYGIGKEYSRDVWYELCNSLTVNGYIAADENRLLQVTSFGLSALKARAKILLPIDLDALQRQSYKTSKSNVYSVDTKGARYNKSELIDGLSSGDKLLYEDLRQWRWEVASKEGVPPYIIFWDSVLFNIIKARPKNISDLENIAGLGGAKIIKWGDEIISIVSRHYPLL